MSIVWIRRLTIRESFELGHRKSTDNFTEIYCDKCHISGRDDKRRGDRTFRLLSRNYTRVVARHMDTFQAT